MVVEFTTYIRLFLAVNLSYLMTLATRAIAHQELIQIQFQCKLIDTKEFKSNPLVRNWKWKIIKCSQLTKFPREVMVSSRKLHTCQNKNTKNAGHVYWMRNDFFASIGGFNFRRFIEFLPWCSRRYNREFITVN